MPFDFLATKAVATAQDYRRLPGGGVDYDHYRALARREQAMAVGRALQSLAGLCRAGLAGWLERRERTRQRRQILAMDDRMLRDIGLSRVDAIQGVRRTLHRP